jgi:hypothetical protein
LSLRFYLDEDLQPRIAAELRRRDVDAVSAQEEGARAWPDELQLAHAAGAGRALVTCNYTDYLAPGAEWFAAGREHAGIIVSYRQFLRAEVGVAVAALERISRQFDQVAVAGAVIVLDDFI